MATISKKEVHKFLDKHPDIPFSAAEFEYSSYLESEAVEYANAISAKALNLLQFPPDKGFRFQRKPLSGGN